MISQYFFCSRPLWYVLLEGCFKKGVWGIKLFFYYFWQIKEFTHQISVLLDALQIRLLWFGDLIVLQDIACGAMAIFICQRFKIDNFLTVWKDLYVQTVSCHASWWPETILNQKANQAQQKSYQMSSLRICESVKHSRGADWRIQLCCLTGFKVMGVFIKFVQNFLFRNNVNIFVKSYLKKNMFFLFIKRCMYILKKYLCMN